MRHIMIITIGFCGVLAAQLVPAQGGPPQQVRIHDVRSLLSARGSIGVPGVPDNPEELCFYLTLENAGDQPVRVLSLQVVWVFGGRVIATHEEIGPAAPLLPGGRTFHAFRVPHTASSKWTANTQFRIEVAAVQRVALTQDEQRELRRRAQALSRVRVLNARPVFEVGVHWGDQLTVINQNDGTVDGVLIHLLGYDRNAQVVKSVMYYLASLPPGVTRISADVGGQNDIGRLIAVDFTASWLRNPWIRVERYEGRVVEVEAQADQR